MRSFDVFVRPDSLVAKTVAEELSSYLESLGWNRSVDPDVTFVIGGDGTFLHAVQTGGKLFFPIKLGRIGFFYEVDATNYRPYLERFLNGDYKVVEYKRINFMGYDCINEHYITSKNSGKVIVAAVYIEDELYRKGLADGIMISTPLASTAYSLSVGGPLLDPELDAVVLNVVNPMGGPVPSLVVNDPTRINVQILPTRRGQKLVVDGIDRYSFNMVLEESPKRGSPFRIVRFGNTGIKRLIRAWRKLRSQ